VSSPSIVRIAGPQDFDECWRMLMESHGENALFPLAEDKVRWFVNRVIYPETIRPDDVGIRGIIGVIGPVGAIEGLVFLTIGSYWYSNALHIEEYMVFVDPKHRRSSHAKALVSWMKQQVEATGLPLITGIMSTHRLEAKCRLYQRLLPKVGEFFYLAPKGSQYSAPALSYMSS
jgi:GNAT superfamily N-acetyltransferase